MVEGAEPSPRKTRAHHGDKDSETPTVKVCKRNGCVNTPWPYGAAGPGLPTSIPQAPSIPSAPAIPAVPSLPPSPSGVVLPPLNGTGPRQAEEVGESRMTLMSPVGANEDDETDWAVVIGIALVAEVALLWGAACVALWRRRVALERLGAAPRTGGGDGPAAG
ncbi:hypothetical protein [Actinomadura chibensis]|uniref:Uncharacterized protein n=1 Tax=Actinomadura chibensis TaxID=392828 RepID=A0A5D0NXA5_9ACTN|nr:hypothetical protein [Actinomadura chibensis]TYB49117.1 hypothetical protein FXF69_08270 [Actinomadura chibensis]